MKRKVEYNCVLNSLLQPYKGCYHTLQFNLPIINRTYKLYYNLKKLTFSLNKLHIITFCIYTGQTVAMEALIPSSLIEPLQIARQVKLNFLFPLL